jgi:hypothetical protein
MKKESLIVIIVYIFLFVSGSIYGIGERTIVLGGESGWRMAESRAGVTEVRFVRPNPVLVLSSQTGFSTIGYSAASGVLGNFSAMSEPALDLSISFDENNTGLYRDSIGKYKVSVSPDVEAADRRYARAGTGAALFHGNGPVIVEPQRTNALFVPNNRMRDFSVEFWLYPQNMENGEQVLSWSGTKYINGNFAVQRILCIASKNKLQWSFVNFFTSTDSLSHINIEFSGNTPVVPKTWSHHLVRFDSGTGMVEYLVNGVSEAVCYATSTGQENSEVYTPVAGSNGMFLLGENFRGLIDEFKIHSICAGRSSTSKYVPSGGRTETRAIDLGHNESGVVRIDASGGRISIRENVTHNEFRENGRFRFSDDAEMSFFIRSNENPYLLNNSQWVSFTPGVNFSGIMGRYVQIAVDFYPSADGETSPYLEQLRIIYSPGEPPLPPKNFTAVAVDGGVLLRWKQSPNADDAGYLVYYSSVRGELFGNDSVLGPSPVNAGNRTSLLVEGLKNGTLYYFRIASYDRATGEVNYNVGEFSNEVTARPLAGLLLSDIQ